MSLPASRLSIAAALLVLAGALAGCADGADPAPEPAVHTADNGEVFNDADVAFATDLLQHHAAALTLVDLTRTVSVSPALAGLAEEILSTQSVEIETLTDWLAAWDVEAPETIRDHANAGHDHDGGEQTYADIPGADLPGMPSAADLTALAALTGPEFEERWLELMIAHHEGAVEIAEAEVEDGEHPQAVDLAAAVVTAQEDQLARMETLLSGS